MCSELSEATWGFFVPPKMLRAVKVLLANINHVNRQNDLMRKRLAILFCPFSCHPSAALCSLHCMFAMKRLARNGGKLGWLTAL